MADYWSLGCHLASDLGLSEDGFRRIRWIL